MSVRRSRQRSTLPKTKGCYECSQRRISCDRGQPSCNKCVTKGIRCSGLGVRYRFESGVASRGKMVGKSIKDVMDERVKEMVPIAATNIQASCKEPPDQASKCIADAQTPGKHTEIVSTSATTPQPCWTESPIHDQIDFIPQWKEFLLSYFSQTIAPQMLAIDGPTNGWRHIVLPVSTADHVVMSAVLATSAYHASLKSNALLSVAQAAYMAAIKGLQARQNLKSNDQLVNCYTTLTILLLLVSAMATGSSDFPPLFRMLKSAMKTVGEGSGLGDGQLGKFLLRQTQKFSVYAEPLLSEKDGIEAVRSRASQSFECLQRCSVLHPEHFVSLQNVRSQIEQAYNIYLRRALGTCHDPSLSVLAVEQLKQTVEAFPTGCPGEHVLVWASFIVAAESSTPEHRAFFANRMQSLYCINGFGNIIKALKLLQDIWTGTSETRWTSIIAQANLFVM